MKKTSTENIVLMAMLSALVIILQLLSLVFRAAGFPFAISLALVPIVIGSAVGGPKSGAFLGLVCAIVILITDSAAFLAINIPGTILTVVLKGILCGAAAGIVYKALSKKTNPYIAVTTSALICPLVNTSVFLLGCFAFFIPTLKEWMQAEGYDNVISYMLFFLVGINFIIEIAVNMILSPVIVRLIKVKSNNLY